jgi:ABC-type uncharacterized transport system permease subunit
MRVRLEPRLTDPSLSAYALRAAVGVGLALALSAALLALSDHPPASVLDALVRGAFGSWPAVQSTLTKAVPIGLCAVGIALASRANLTNIGAEGQFFFGAFAATGIGLNLPEDTSHPLAVALVLGAGVLGGAAWAGLAAIPRAVLGMSEILTTLMLNYICLLWINFLVRGPWADPLTFSFPYSPPILDAGQLGPVFGAIQGGFPFLLAAVALLALVDSGTRWGYELRVAGDAPEAARYGGINAAWIVISGLCASGALAGLAGAIEISATTGRLQTGLSPGYGFMGVLVAWLAGGRPLPILLVSILYAGLLNGGFSLQIAHIPGAISTVLQATILICILGAGSLARYRIRIVRSATA